ncbi:MAG: hypothetical protein ABIK59_03100 [candidate division WOR-3 bacterium]|uniref:Uncharacterized protein n=1 Tax=candidate division WOR-3 bacterium TaxID=2052148 RepID=A0A7V4CI50_UNCW3|nr:hypothetical protein [Candidatus Omnitrophota bacterium]
MKKVFLGLLIMLMAIPSFLNAYVLVIRVIGYGSYVGPGYIVLCAYPAPYTCAEIIIVYTTPTPPSEVSQALVEIKEGENAGKKYLATFAEPIPTNISEIYGENVKISQLIPVEE